MADLYVVLVVTLLAWAGVYLLLWRLDTRIKELEKQ